MEFEIKEHEKYIFFVLQEKKFIVNNAPKFKTQLMYLIKENKSLICDMSNIDYVDSSGLSALLVGDRLLKQQNNLFILCNVSKKVTELIELTKLNKILLVIEDSNEAKDYIMFNELEKEL